MVCRAQHPCVAIDGAACEHHSCAAAISGLGRMGNRLGVCRCVLWVSKLGNHVQTRQKVAIRQPRLGHRACVAAGRYTHEGIAVQSVPNPARTADR